MILLYYFAYVIWRIISNSIKKPYFEYNKEELIAIIIGHKTKPIYIDRLKKLLPKDFPIFKTYPGSPSGKMHFLPYDYVIEYDGSEPDFIDTTEELIEAIEKY